MTLTAVHGVGIFTGQNTTKNKTVTFEGSPGNITSIEGGPGWEQSDEVIDGTGCTLVPGMIDAEVDTAASSSSLETLASYGISTAIDMSSSEEEKQAMRAASAAEMGLPTFLACGAVAVGANSRPSPAAELRSTAIVRTPDEAEAFVQSCIHRGPEVAADYIKALVDMSGMDESVLQTLVDATHRAGKLAVAHMTQAAAYDRAIRAGFDIISHAPVDGPLDAAVCARMAERGIVCVPLLYKMRKVAALLHQQGQQGPNIVGTSAEEQDQPTGFEYALAAVRSMRDAGVKICAGTGATQQGQVPIPFGESLHEELRLLGVAGLDNLEVACASTHTPSATFRLHDRGQVSSGLQADLLLVEGDPLRDISALSRIRKAWIKGVEVAPRLT
jgi:imidazolonepropionase-like amidohydrolase